MSDKELAFFIGITGGVCAGLIAEAIFGPMLVFFAGAICILVLTIVLIRKAD